MNAADRNKSPVAWVIMFVMGVNKDLDKSIGLHSPNAIFTNKSMTDL